MAADGDPLICLNSMLNGFRRKGPLSLNTQSEREKNMKSKTVAYFDLLMAAMSLTMALALPAGAQQVKMAYSGTSGASAVNLQQPGTVTVEENFEGNGALGPFTVRIISAETTSPQEPPKTCSGPLTFISQGTPARAYFASRITAY